MGNMDDALHRFDDTQHDEPPTPDEAAVRALFARAGIALLRVTDMGNGRVMVEVPPQKNVLGRIKRLYDAMTDVKFSVMYGANVQADNEAYWLSKLD